MNIVVLSGRLVIEPQMNDDECRFVLAVERPYSENRNVRADFINIVADGEVAKFVDRYIKRNDKVTVSGQLEQRVYTDENDTDKSDIEVRADKVEFAENTTADYLMENGIESEEEYKQNSVSTFDDILDEETNF